MLPSSMRSTLNNSSTVVGELRNAAPLIAALKKQYLSDTGDLVYGLKDSIFQGVKKEAGRAISGAKHLGEGGA